LRNSVAKEEAYEKSQEALKQRIVVQKEIRQEKAKERYQKNKANIKNSCTDATLSSVIGSEKRKEDVTGRDRCKTKKK